MEFSEEDLRSDELGPDELIDVMDDNRARLRSYKLLAHILFHLQLDDKFKKVADRAYKIAINDHSGHSLAERAEAVLFSMNI